MQPAPYNPRAELRPGDPGFDRLKRSIAEFDLVQPIIWNRLTGHIVGGHQRLTVLKAMGHNATDCVVVELPLDKEKALNIALNNPHVGGRWDSPRLVELLQELVQAPDVDATLTGFDERQLRDLILEPATERQIDESSPSADEVVVTLNVPKARWPAVEPHLNALLSAVPDLRLHWQ